MPGSFSQFVQIAMSLWDTTADEIANFRESPDARRFSHHLSTGLQSAFAKMSYLFVSKTPTSDVTSVTGMMMKIDYATLSDCFESYFRRTGQLA